MSSQRGSQYCCSLCDHFSATTIGGILRHVGAVHAHEPHFHLVCGINGCPRTYKNFHSFRKHLRRRHAQTLDTTESAASEVTSNGGSHQLEVEGFDSDWAPSSCSPTELPVDREESFKRSTAMFILKTKEVNGVSQVALNELIEDVTMLVQRTVDSIKLRVEHVLTRNGVCAAEIEGLCDIFHMEELCSPFRGLHSEFLQHKTFKDLFGLVVSAAIT